MKLSNKEYDSITAQYVDYGDRIVEGIENAIRQVAEEYSGQTYICDAISESADYNVSIWNAEVLRQAEYLNEDVGLAIREGLADVKADDFDLIHLLRVAWYTVNERAIYDAIPLIAYNYMADLLNDNAELSGDVESLEESLWEVAQNADNNSAYYELEESAACELASWLGESVADMNNPLQEIVRMSETQPTGNTGNTYTKEKTA